MSVSVFDPIVMADQPTDEADPFTDGCPNCQAQRHEAPEGVHDVHSVVKNPGVQAGDPKWSYQHCWKCGFRPGVNIAVSQKVLNDAYERIKASIMEELQRTNQRGLEPPQSVSEVEQLKADLEKSKADNLALIEQLRKDPGNNL